MCEAKTQTDLPEHLYLPIDQVPMDAHDVQSGLSEMSSLACSGGSGLIRLLGRDSLKYVRPLLVEGQRFLSLVQRDCQLMRKGTDIWAQDSKVDYHPGLAMSEFAHIIAAKGNLAVPPTTGETISLVEDYVTALQPLFTSLTSRKHRRPRLAEILEKLNNHYLPLQDSYVTLFCRT